MMLWQKQASPKWLAAHEAFLEEFAPGKVAVVTRPGRVRLLVEVFCESRSTAEQMQRKLGGRAIKLPRNWLALS